MMDTLTTQCLGFKPKYLKRSEIPDNEIQAWKDEVKMIIRY